MGTSGPGGRPSSRQEGAAWGPALALSALGVSATLGLAGLSLSTAPGVLDGVLDGGTSTSSGTSSAGGTAYQPGGPAEVLTAQGPSVSRALVAQQAQRPEAPAPAAEPLEGIVLLSAAPRGQVLEQTVIEPAQERLEALAALRPLLDVAEPLTGVDADEVLASMAELPPVLAPEAAPASDESAIASSPVIAQAPTTPDRTPTPQPSEGPPDEPAPETGGPISRRMPKPPDETTTPTDPTPGTTDPTTAPGSTPTDPGTTPTDPGTTPTDPGTTPADPGTTPADPGSKSPTGPTTPSTATATAATRSAPSAGATATAGATASAGASTSAPAPGLP
ncbi:hypothetical protein [Arsenicicoccus cauae]|uniref:hypothetical protein n=1 Tax=Arsenicicoccus cauae TaxID=2663847 RepID=UPI0018A7D0BB|nr:hypothetical protein [Arsenicicoccus cauae]